MTVILRAHPVNCEINRYGSSNLWAFLQIPINPTNNKSPGQVAPFQWSRVYWFSIWRKKAENPFIFIIRLKAITAESHHHHLHPPPACPVRPSRIIIVIIIITLYQLPVLCPELLAATEPTLSSWGTPPTTTTGVRRPSHSITLRTFCGKIQSRSVLYGRSNGVVVWTEIKDAFRRGELHCTQKRITHYYTPK